MKGSLFLTMLLAAVFAGCGKTISVNAPREKEGISLVQYACYDAESKIRYMVSNNDSHVCLRFDTDNMATMMRIRNFGAIVRFSSKGKNKLSHWLKYPVYNPEDLPALRGGDLKIDLFPRTTTAIWASGEEEHLIDLGHNAEGFFCQLEIDAQNVLVYQVGIPFKQLGANRPEDFPGLIMALEIPSPDAGKITSSGSPNSAMPNNMNPGTPGAMNSNNPGSMQGPSASGGMMGSGGTTGTPTIRIKMDVRLSPSANQ